MSIVCLTVPVLIKRTKKEINHDQYVQQYITVNTIFICTITNGDWPIHTSFPKISGRLVNLRGLSIDDANDISRLMTYNISNSDSSLVGIISLKNIDLDNKNANLGYWIGELYWGNGIVSESVALVVNHAFSVLGLEEVYAYIYSENKASMRVLEKNGMTKKGEANEYSKKLGRFQNTTKFVIKRQ